MQRTELPSRILNLPASIRLLLALTMLLWFGCNAAKVTNSSSPSTPAEASLSASSSSLGFGSVQVGQSKSLSFTLTNTATQTTTVQISQVVISGTGFNASAMSLPLTLAAGHSATITVTFKPSASGTANGSVSIVSNASNSTMTVSLSGSGIVSAGQLNVSPTALSFGSLPTNSSKTLPLTLTNPAGGAPVQISQLTISGATFSFTGASPPVTLAAGQSITLNVTFHPNTGAAATGTLAITSNAANTSLSVALSGVGIAPGQLSVSPGALHFSNVNIGTTQNQSASLAAGSARVTVSSATWTGAGFSVSGISFPVTIAAGQSVPFTVTFAPQAPGAVTGGISFLSNATNSPTAESWDATGVQASQHSVGLTWNPDASQVQGYYVYRGTVSGGPYARISSLLSAAAYTDTTVASGQTYYYVVTAVGTNSMESAYSSQVTAAIP